MNRTAIVTAAALLACGAPWLPTALAQKPTTAAANPAPAPPKADPIDELVAAMQAAEGRLKSIAIRMSTSGVLPGGLSVATRGALHVLRGAQASIHAEIEATFDDGIRGTSESVQTADGILWYESNPAFGEVFVQLDKSIVADLEWAGEVLQREDLPGMADRRAMAPLGSTMVSGLKRQFELAVGERKERNGEAGTWLAGKRKPGVDVKDPELPIADAVELFVRDKDHALLEVRQLQGEQPIQTLVVEQLDVDVELPAKTFEISGHGQTLRSVEQYQPLWDLIKQALARAEAKTAKEADEKNAKLPPDTPEEQRVQPEVRPSKRTK